MALHQGSTLSSYEDMRWHRMMNCFQPFFVYYVAATGSREDNFNAASKHQFCVENVDGREALQGPSGLRSILNG